MSKYEQYAKKLEAELGQWKARLDGVLADARLAGTKGADELRARWAEMEREYAALRAQGEKRLEQTRESFEAKKKDLEQAFEALRGRKKPEG